MENEQQADIDMMAAVTGEDYFNLKMKVFCLQANKNTFSLDFVECFRRSSYLAHANFKKISEMTLQMNLMDNNDDDPSYFQMGKPEKSPQ